jgi:hypothetical protein
LRAGVTLADLGLGVAEGAAPGEGISLTMVSTGAPDVLSICTGANLAAVDFGASEGAAPGGSVPLALVFTEISEDLSPVTGVASATLGFGSMGDDTALFGMICFGISFLMGCFTRPGVTCFTKSIHGRGST